jgi:hypothetical protein
MPTTYRPAFSKERKLALMNSSSNAEANRFFPCKHGVPGPFRPFLSPPCFTSWHDSILTILFQIQIFLLSKLKFWPQKSSRALRHASAVCTRTAEALKWLNKVKNDPYMAYLKRKLGQWYSEAPRP